MLRIRWIVVLVVASVAGLVLVPMASASSVTSPAAQLYQGGQVAHVVAGSKGGLKVSFTASSALGAGDTVTITGPVGANFDSALLTNGYPVVNLMTNDTTAPGSYYGIPSASISNGGRSITFEVPGSFSLAAGEQASVYITVAQSYVTFGTTAGANSFQLSTNKDSIPVDTPTYQTTPAAPASLFLLDGPQHTAFNQLFDPMRVVVEDQYYNPIPGQNVSATVAPSDASGTFPGGQTVAQVVTGTDGIAALPRITANSQIGFWHLELVGPGAINDYYEMRNLAYGDAANVDLTLAPPSIPADGSSMTTATATVTDQYGNLVPDETLVLSSNNGQPVGTVTDNGHGTYTGQVTSTTKAGQSTITATDNSAHDPLSGTATLTQTALPAKTVTLTLSPSSLPANGKSTTTAKAVVRDKFGNPVPGATVSFKSDGGQSIGAVKNGGQGQYMATITASKSSGTSQIYATVTGTSPAVTASASLTQKTVKVAKPVLKFKHPPKKRVKSAKVKFRFKVVKGKAKGFQCKLDHKKWSRCKSPKKVKLKRGKHVFKVRGIATNGTHGKVLKRRIKRVR